MAVKNYSLADYDFAIRSIDRDGTVNDKFNLTLGGAGNFLGSVKVDFDGEVWSKEADVLGNVVFTKSYDRSGSITISLNMLSENVQWFNRILQVYYSGAIRSSNYSQEDDPMFSINIYRAGVSKSSTPEVEATYCMLKANPSIEFGDTAAMREYTFLAAEIGTPSSLDEDSSKIGRKTHSRDSNTTNGGE